nr:MAG: coat protein [Leviviridae sp.]
MLDNIITLPVDVLNNGSTVNKAYVRSEEYLNRTVYEGPAHSLVAKDTLSVYRTPVKKSGTDLGTAKSAMKFTEDLTVLNAVGENVSKPAILNVEASFPVGITAAKALELRQRAIAGLDHAFAATLMEKLQV